jgi:hypothetical protein
MACRRIITQERKKNVDMYHFNICIKAMQKKASLQDRDFLLTPLASKGGILNGALALIYNSKLGAIKSCLKYVITTYANLRQ